MTVSMHELGVVDHVAVERFASGDDDVALSHADRLAVVKELQARGVSNNEIMRRLRLNGTEFAKLRDSLGGGLPVADSLRSHSELRRIPLELIDPHPANVRETLGEEDLLELAESIRTVGLLQPIVVAPKPGGRFEILAGHRRHAAILLITEQSVPCVVRSRRPERAEVLELMLVENLHRRALNPIEEAEAYQALVNMGQTQTAIGHAVGKSITHVSQRLSLLLLPAEQQRALVRREMTVVDAYEMAREIREKTTGRKHGLTGRTRERWGKRYFENTVPHFNPRHPLAPTARQRCENGGHQDFARIGGACGPCWEATIRGDALASVGQVAS